MKTKSLFDFKLFKDFLTNEDKTKKLQEIPATRLQQFTIKLVLFL